MSYQFAFNEKREVIFVDEAPVKSKIGTLIRTTVDTDWTAVEHKIKQLPDEKIWGNTAEIFLLKKSLSEMIHHPGLIHHLTTGVTRESFFDRLDELIKAKETVLYVMEALIDEEKKSLWRNTVRPSLFEPNKLLQNVLQFKEARVLPFTERVMPIYAAAREFSFLFETNDIRVVLFQEIQYLCNNNFIIRKCGYCKRFFWTQKTNETRCNRKLKGIDQSCKNNGPALINLGKQTAAYEIYWNMRTKLFHRQLTQQDKERFRSWVERAEVFRNAAKEGNISEFDLIAELKKIERETYGNRLMLSLHQGTGVR